MVYGKHLFSERQVQEGDINLVPCRSEVFGGMVWINHDDDAPSLRESLGPAWKDTIVLMATEFGRTAHANGTGGTDHGTGTATLLAGGSVSGGKVLGKWPGLAEANLYQGRDLMPTTDLRAVVKTVLREHLRIPQDRLESTVFPNSSDATPIAGITASA